MTYYNLDKGLPRQGLESSINKGILLYKKLGNKSFETKDIYKNLSLSIKSGHAGRVISSMKYYGIIEGWGSEYKINEKIKKYSSNNTIDQKDFLSFLSNVPLYKNILKEFSVEDVLNINNKNKIREYINKLNLDGKNTVEVFFEINDSNITSFKNLKINDNYKKIEKTEPQIENIVPVTLKNNDLHNYLTFSIGTEKNIEIKYPKEVDKEEIELIETALEFIKKIISKAGKGGKNE